MFSSPTAGHPEAHRGHGRAVLFRNEYVLRETWPPYPYSMRVRARTIHDVFTSKDTATL